MPPFGDGGTSSALTSRTILGPRPASTTGIASDCISARRRARLAALARRPRSSISACATRLFAALIGESPRLLRRGRERLLPALGRGDLTELVPVQLREP